MEPPKSLVKPQDWDTSPTKMLVRDFASYEPPGYFQPDSPSQQQRQPQSEPEVDAVEEEETLVVPWLASILGYISVLGLVVFLTYPFQASRSWKSPLFDPPGYLHKDTAAWIQMAETQPFLSEAGSEYLRAPFYAAQAFAMRYGLGWERDTLYFYRALNVFWFVVAAWGLRRWTLCWTPDPWVGLWAGLMFALSPFVQIFLSQPVPDMMGAACSIWALTLILWGVGIRPGRPWPSKIHPAFLLRPDRWIFIGALTGLLMLGKELSALYLCLLGIGVARRAWRAIASFVCGALMVHALEISWVVLVVERRDIPYGSSIYEFLGWFLAAPRLQAWKDLLAAIGIWFGYVGFRTVQAFFFWPVALALVGWFALWHRPRWYDLVSYAVACCAFFGTLLIVTPRICFMIFYPVILPLAAAGMVGVGRFLKDRGWVRGSWIWHGFLFICFLFSVLLNPYWFFNYG